MMCRNFEKILVIGGAGFVGKYFIELLLNKGITVVATKTPHETTPDLSCEWLDLDITDKNQVSKIVNLTQPDAIVNLAAQSSVKLSWKNPSLTMDININGTINILEAIKCVPSNPRLLLISSSEEYGNSGKDISISESCQTNPSNPYAISKSTQTTLAALYRNAFNIDVITMRAFNHIGAGQNYDFVVPDFCRQISLIENKKQKPVIYVGDLSPKRDFSDVRDIVRGYYLALIKGNSGEIYNIGSGISVSINEILKTLVNLSSQNIVIEIDPAKIRPVEIKSICANISKLKLHTGYAPEIDLAVSLESVLNYERKINLSLSEGKL